LYLLPCLRHAIEDRADGRIAHPTDGRSPVVSGLRRKAMDRKPKDVLSENPLPRFIDRTEPSLPSDPIHRWIGAR